MPEPRPTNILHDHARSERLHEFAHDLRNRLTGLWEVMKAMRSGTSGMDPDELYAHAEKGYFKAQREIEDLLDDLHVDRRVRIAAIGPVVLADVLAGSVTREQHRLERKAQVVTLHGDQHARVLGDPLWIGQVLQALISNASKFSPRESTIHADIVREGSQTRVRITDPGVGMDRADLDQVFVRFALLGSHSTNGEPQSRGTLARARQWAEAMQGELVAHSEGAGHGASFTLILPTAN